MRALGVDGQIPLSAFGQRLKKSVTGRFIPGPPICVRMVLGFFPIASPWWRWPFAPMIALPQTPGGLFPYLGDQQASESVLASCSPIYRSLPRFVSLWSAGWSNFWFIPSPKNRTLLWTAGWNETKIGRDLQRGLQASQTLQDLLIPPGIYQYILGMWEAEDLPIFFKAEIERIFSLQSPKVILQGRETSKETFNETWVAARKKKQRKHAECTFSMYMNTDIHDCLCLSPAYRYNSHNQLILYWVLLKIAENWNYPTGVD